MMYNQVELKAMQMIASKLNWHKPAYETVKTITKMVRNQQALELDTVGECDDFEETLLSIALWNKDDIISTMYVNDYESMVMWNVECFCEDMGITAADYANMVTYYGRIQPEVIADEYEAWLEDYYSDYDAEIMRDVMWMNKHC